MKIGPPLKIRVGVLLREKHPLQQLDSKQGVGLTDDELLVMQLWPQVISWQKICFEDRFYTIKKGAIEGGGWA